MVRLRAQIDRRIRKRRYLFGDRGAGRRGAGPDAGGARVSFSLELGRGSVFLGRRVRAGQPEHRGPSDADDASGDLEAAFAQAPQFHAASLALQHPAAPDHGDVAGRGGQGVEGLIHAQAPEGGWRSPRSRGGVLYWFSRPCFVPYSIPVACA